MSRLRFLVLLPALLLVGIVGPGNALAAGGNTFQCQNSSSTLGGVLNVSMSPGSSGSASITGSTPGVNGDTYCELHGTVPSGWTISDDGRPVTLDDGSGNDGTFEDDDANLLGDGTFTNGGMITFRVDTAESSGDTPYTTIIADTDVINTGTIEAQDGVGLTGTVELGYQSGEESDAQPAVSAGDMTFDNAGGTFNVDSGAQVQYGTGSGAGTGDTLTVDNAGAISVASGASETYGGSNEHTCDGAGDAVTFDLQSGGTVDNDGTISFYCNNFDVDGGTLSGSGSTTLYNSDTSLNFGADAAPGTAVGDDTIQLDGTTMTGTIPSGWTVNVASGPTLTVPSSEVNDGTIDFADQNTTLDIDGGTGSFTNNGAVLVGEGHGVRITFETSEFVNNGAFDMVMPEQGTPGAGAIPQLFDGDFTESAGSSIGVQFFGPSSCSCNLTTIDVDGTATLDGALDAEATSGYSPSSGEAYTFLDAGTLNGTFSSTTAGFTTSYSGTAATITTATGTYNPLTVTVAGAAAGLGSVTDGGQLDCTGFNSPCTTQYSSVTSVTLTETPGSGSVFTGWSGGGCSGTATTCTVAMSSAQSVTATFAVAPETLTVMIAGAGSGTVGDGASLSCTTATSPCSNSYPAGTTVTLTEAPASGSTFAGWSDGGCTGTAATCEVTMSSAQSVKASFTEDTEPLTVSVTGTGTVSDGATLSCTVAASPCVQPYPDGTAVTLTETPASGWRFTGWAGDCSGTRTTCTVTLSAAEAVTAGFTQVQETLNVSVSGTGDAGFVTDGGSFGCDSGHGCSHTYPQGTAVTLTEFPSATAYPNPAATFAGWGGACSGKATTCTVTMSAAKTVTATFTSAPSTEPLSVTVNGAGLGSVSGGAINCPGTCSAAVARGSTVTLTAKPTLPGDAVLDTELYGWSGACSGSGTTCTITISAAESVTATFVSLARFTFGTVSVAGGTGTVALSVGSASATPVLKCAVGAATCNTLVPADTPLYMTATPASGSSFVSWSGDCSSTNPVCSTSIGGGVQSAQATFSGSAHSGAGPSSNGSSLATKVDCTSSSAACATSVTLEQGCLSQTSCVTGGGASDVAGLARVIVYGRGTARIPAHRTRTVTVRLTRAAGRALKRHGRLRAVEVIKISVNGHLVVTRIDPVTVRLKRKA
jgi:Divergent InlB B-repeat domain